MFSSKNCIIALSPMDDVTDHPFRKICKQMGADIVVTEFIASEALNREAEKSRRKMLFDDEQRPIGIQIFGADEGELLQCLEIVEQAEPDFIDINWGCPVKKVAGKGAGSGILKEPDKMIRITESIVKHAHLPVTVKTRLGYDDSNKPIVEIAERLQDVGISALAIHGRTKTQMYKGEADWTLIGEVKNNQRITIPIFGNGDITTAQQAIEHHKRYGVDGILIGRAAIGNPWIFAETKALINNLPYTPPTVAERAVKCLDHLHAEVEYKGEHSTVFEMRKHYGGYFYGIPNFKPYRLRLVATNSLHETEEVLHEITNTFQDN